MLVLQRVCGLVVHAAWVASQTCVSRPTAAASALPAGGLYMLLKPDKCQPPWHAYKARTPQAKPHLKDGATWEAVQKGQLETLRQACGEPLHVQLIGVPALWLQKDLCQQRTPLSAWPVQSWGGPGQHLGTALTVAACSDSTGHLACLPACSAALTRQNHCASHCTWVGESVHEQGSAPGSRERGEMQPSLCRTKTPAAACKGHRGWGSTWWLSLSAKRTILSSMEGQ